MALFIYTDEATTTRALPNEVFDDEVTGSQVNFPLVFLTGTQVGSVYEELRTTYTGVTFASGVSSALTGAAYTVDALIGQRVIHNGEFRGTIASNTADTVTLDTTYTQATASSAIISNYVSKRLTTDYSILGNTVTMVVAPAATSRLHVVPNDDAGLAFGGDAGTNVTVTGSVWLKREPGYQYRALKAYSQDNSVDDVYITQAGVTSTGTTVSGYTGLGVNIFAGYAFWQNSAFRGLVVSNTASTLTLDRPYENAVASDAILFNIGPMELSLDNITFDYVISVPDITTDTPVRIYFKDTVRIPTQPLNYPNVVIKTAGLEYLE